MTEFKLPSSNLPWLQDRTIFLTEHGSQAYGTAMPTSDTDYKGVCIPPAKYFHGYLERFEQFEHHHTPDLVLYDIRKFFKLAADCNPSIIETLFTDESNHMIRTPLGDKLLKYRDLFVSKKAKHTFSGYAVGQLKRIKGHYRYVTNPIAAPPDRATMGLPESTVIPRDQLQAAQSMIRKKVEAWTNVPVDELDEAAKIAVQERFMEALVEIKGATELETLAGKTLGFSSNFLELLDKERQWNQQIAEWRSYQTWLTNRNEARSELERKYGYDTKHGMHLVRLLRMGEEILLGKGVVVRRPDAEELLAIRNGAWTYEQLLEYAESKLLALDELYRTSKAVPGAPDRNRLDMICQELVEEML